MKTSVKLMPIRSLAILSLGAISLICLSGCSAIIEGLIDGASDRRAEKRYERDGATPREAKQMVFEDDFFKDVGGRPGYVLRDGDPLVRIKESGTDTLAKKIQRKPNKTAHPTAGSVLLGIQASIPAVDGLDVRQEMKNSRAELLEQLAWRRGSRLETLRELQAYGWDSDSDHFVIPAAAIVNVIDLRLKDSISELELVEWAESFECREDVTYEDGDGNVLSEIVFQLANPEINCQLTNDSLQMLKRRCSAIEEA